MDARERGLWLLVAVALAGDVVTTFLGLRLGLAESNPIARGAIDGWGMAGMFALKGLAVAVAVACRPILDREYRPIVPAALALPWLFAALVNVYSISAAL
ncbi:DUF5658 family protein [Salinilacihabitans rarus]|uniref:DUF5658 family protein n=1 Tax=Salinilacihabitans rarus TaxID=2961596 RepID=UPI0020C862DB|nr:DUF5658 family protein [Salinilacihabitans rarus]